MRPTRKNAPLLSKIEHSGATFIGISVVNIFQRNQETLFNNGW
jgi:hypothetical protein